MKTPDKVARTSVALASLALLAYLVRDQIDSLRVLGDVDWHDLIGLSLFFLASHVVMAALWNWALGRQGCVLGLADNFLLTFLRTYWNLLFPWAGGSAAGIYLKKRVGLAYSTYVHILWELSWTGLATISIAGAVAFVTAPGRPDVQGMAIVVLGALGVFSLAMARITRFPSIGKTLPARFRKWLQHRVGPLANAMPIIPLLAFALGLFLLRTGRTWLLFLAIDSPVPIVDAVLFTVFAELSVAVNLTPNGLGIREAAISITAGVLGHEPGLGLAAGILDRLVFSFWVLVLGQVAIWKLRWSSEERQQ